MKEEDYIYGFGILVSKLINRFKNPQKIDFKKILVIKLDEIGDVVNAVHVFALLKTKFPTAYVAFWCKPFVRSLVENDPNIDYVVHRAEELTEKYDLIVDLRGNWETIRYALFNPPKYRLDRGIVRLRNKLFNGHPHEVMTNLQIIKPLLKNIPEKPLLKLYSSEEQLNEAKQYIKDNQLASFAVIHCGTRRSLKKWNLNGFAAIATFLKSEKGLDIVFAGDQTDVQDIQLIQKKMDVKTYSIAGCFSLAEYAALVSMASIFIGNDSGPLHIAAIANIPVVGLFGPCPPVTFYPYGEKSRYVHHVLDCNPCDQIHCVRPDNPCIDLVTVEEVKEKIKELIG